MNILYINCKHSKKDYYKTFVSIKSLENNVNITELTWLNKHSRVYQVLLRRNLDDSEFVNIKSVKNNKKMFKRIDNENFDIKNAKIVLNLNYDYNNDVDDIYYYKYFSLLQMNCFNCENRYIFFNYNKGEIFKIASYIFFNYFSANNIYCLRDDVANSVDRLTSLFAISEEWLPVMPLNQELLDALKCTLKLSDILDFKGIKIYSQNKIDFTGIYSLNKNDNKYLVYFKTCLNIWLKKYSKIETYISDKIENLPLLSLLIFVLQYIKGNSYNDNHSRINKLIDVSCDYGEGLLQLAENVLYHSNGGALSIRLNDKKYKIKQYNKEYYGWYLRMSVCDFSNSSIICNLKNKSKHLDSLKLSDVFFDNENKEYVKYLNFGNNLIHHYGLMTFSQIVSQNDGSFAVFSSTDSKKNIDNYYNVQHNEISEKDISNDDLVNYHIPGTDYDILLPVYSHTMKENTYSSSLPTNQILNRKKFDNEISVTAVFDFFSQERKNKVSLDNIQNELKGATISEQSKKEQIINKATEELYAVISNEVKKAIKLGNENDSNKFSCLERDYDIIVYFDISNCKFKRIEGICKIIMGLVIKFLTEEYRLHFVLQDFDRNNIIAFVRQYALFYRNNINKYMSKSQIYLQTKDGLTDVLFFTNSLKAVYEYNILMQLENGVNSEITDSLYHIAYRYFNKKSENLSEIFPAMDFESLSKCYYDKNNKPTVKNANPLFYKKLKHVATTDIHADNLGCKISNTHIKANKVHLRDFYEAQILFGNAYWCSKFVDFVFYEIVKDETIDPNLPIILYGYENYSEPMLFSLKERLNDKGYNSDYIIFENSKYITPNNKSDSKIRYLEPLKNKLNYISNLQIISIIGISTTLSTLNAMRNEFISNKYFNGKEDWFIKSLIIFQLYCLNPSENSSIKYNRDMRIVYLNEINKKNLNDVNNNIHTEYKKPKGIAAKYFIDIESDWMEPKTCSLCFPEKVSGNYLDEQILINTNETSTVPTLLIKPIRKLDFAKQKQIYGNKEFAENFLKNNENQEFLYYLHINRGGNHYQYYIRTAALLAYELNNYNNDKGIGLWFEEIKKKIKPNDDKRINILVCPAHFSNETFATAVNKYIFQNNAYLINFDVRKEFRDTFESKYSNYLTVLKLIFDKNFDDIEVKFHYVDDQVVTGGTFYRAKTLVGGLVSKINKTDNVTVFESIITLVDRNSQSSRKNYFDSNQEANFYSYLHFYTPSIRSYGDSCPLCKKVSNSINLSHEASLTFISEYWSDKAEQHKLIPLTEAKKCKLLNIKEKNMQEFRRLQCSEEIWKNIANVKSKEYLADSIIYQYILKKGLNSIDKLEYIISFYKVCSREHVIFQEYINDYIFKILLDTFSLFTDEPTIEKDTIELYKFLYQIICSKKNTYLKGIVYDLYCIVITRLCALGSNWLINKKRLLFCYRIGEDLFSTDSYNQRKLANDISKLYNHLSFGEFLSIQIKKSLFVTDNPSVKTERFNNILEEELKNYE